MGDSASDSRTKNIARKIQSERRSNPADSKMSESHFDEYEHYNFEFDKHIYSGHSGKQRSKREAEEHTNHPDPSGHSRKIVIKMQNTEHNRKTESVKGGPKS